MKRTVFILLSITLILCGCKKSPNVTLVTKGLTFTADVNCADKEYEYSVNLISSSHIIFETVKPERIKGMVIDVKDEVVEVSYGELKYKTTVSDFSENSSVVFIRNAILESENCKIELKEDNYSFKSNENEFDFYLSEMGIPLKIESQKKGITVIVKDAKIRSQAEK